jgi:hypothetical protein
MLQSSKVNSVVVSLYSSELVVGDSCSSITVEFLVHQFLYSIVDISECFLFGVLVVLDCSEKFSSLLLVVGPQSSLSLLIVVVDCLSFYWALGSWQMIDTNWTSSSLNLVVESNRVVSSHISTLLSCTDSRSSSW